MEMMWLLIEIAGPLLLGLALLDSIWRKDLDAALDGDLPRGA